MDHLPPKQHNPSTGEDRMSVSAATEIGVRRQMRKWMLICLVSAVIAGGSMSCSHVGTTSDLTRLIKQYEQADKSPELRYDLPLRHRLIREMEDSLVRATPKELKRLPLLFTYLYEKRMRGPAEALIRSALAEQERKLGPEHPMTLMTVFHLAQIGWEKNDRGTADSLYRRALAGQERVLGAEHPDTLNTLFEFACLRWEMECVRGGFGDQYAAEPIFLRVLARQERSLGLKHQVTLTTVSRLSDFYFNVADYAKAEAMATRAWQGFRDTLGPDHGMTEFTKVVMTSRREILAEIIGKP